MARHKRNFINVGTGHRGDFKINANFLTAVQIAWTNFLSVDQYTRFRIGVYAESMFGCRYIQLDGATATGDTTNDCSEFCIQLTIAFDDAFTRTAQIAIAFQGFRSRLEIITTEIGRRFFSCVDNGDWRKDDK